MPDYLDQGLRKTTGKGADYISLMSLLIISKYHQEIINSLQSLSIKLAVSRMSEKQIYAIPYFLTESFMVICSSIQRLFVVFHR